MGDDTLVGDVTKASAEKTFQRKGVRDDHSLLPNCCRADCRLARLANCRTRAEGNYSDSRDATPTAAQSGHQSWPAPFHTDAEPVATSQYVTPEAPWLEPVQLPLFDLPVPENHLSSGAAPPTSSGDDAGRDDGRIITINVNGQQLRIAKPLPDDAQGSSADKKRAAAGTVHGRLLQKGSPVANCYVVIVPWPKGDKADPSGDVGEPLSTITDGEGR